MHYQDFVMNKHHTLSARPLALACTLFLATALHTADAAASDSAHDILMRSDTIRNPQESFVVNVTISQYENGRLDDQTRVTTHSRKDGDGQFLTLVHIDTPAVDKGKILLRNGNNLWMFDPKSKASVRISPRQRLLGNASSGDVITSNLALDYSVALSGQETVQDGDKNERTAWKLHLTASTAYAPYTSVDLWVDSTNNRPLKGMFYGQSGKLLKVAWYRGWKDVLGVIRPTEVVIGDGFAKSKVTVMQMEHYRPQDLPLSWFNKEWLPHFTLGGQ